MNSQDTSSLVRSDTRSCPSPHLFSNKVARLMWRTVWLFLFRPSPELLHGWRRLLLRIFGAKIGKRVKVMPSVQCWAPWNLEIGAHSSISHDVDLYAVDRIAIGSHATVSQRVFICTASHDIDHPNMPLVTAPVTIRDGAWICAEVYVHPGVTVGVDAVAAVRSAVFHDVADCQVVAGNPAQFLRLRHIAAAGN